MSIIPSIEVAGKQVSISRLGFGCARMFGGSEAGASARLIETALECGIRHFDTAPSYGGGRSEQVLGEVLRGVSGVTFASKIGIPRPALSAVSLRSRWYRRIVRPALAKAPVIKQSFLAFKSRSAAAVKKTAVIVPQIKLEAESVARELEITLSLLRRDRLDLYLLHEPENIVIDADLLNVFVDLRRQGLIQAFGCAFGGTASVWPEQIDIVQSMYSPTQERSLVTTPTRIFHGVMRQTNYNSLCNATLQGPRALASAMKLQPRSVFLFSASSSGQIRGVMTALEEEGILCAS